MVSDILQVGDAVHFLTAPGVRPLLETPPVMRVASFETTVLGHFADRPGIYEDRDVVFLDDTAGPTRGYKIPSGSVRLVDRDLAGDRVRQLHGRPPELLHYTSELPERPYWEGDVVRLRGPLGMLGTWHITAIDYLGLEDGGEAFRGYGLAKAFTPYVTQRGGSWYRERSFQLVERGPVWGAAHGRPSDNQKILAMLAVAAGHIETVPVSSPITPARLLGVVTSGTADAVVPYNPKTNQPPLAYRLTDTRLGEFVAENTIKAFAGGRIPMRQEPQPFARRLYPQGGRPDPEVVRRVLGLASVFGGRI